MKHAREEDVVLAFRQLMEDELRQVQTGKTPVQEELFADGLSTEDSLRRLASRQQQLEREVALLRTIILRLMSEPLDDTEA